MPTLLAVIFAFIALSLLWLLWSMCIVSARAEDDAPQIERWTQAELDAARTQAEVLKDMMDKWLTDPDAPDFDVSSIEPLQLREPSEEDDSS